MMRLVISLSPIDQSNWRDALDVLVTDDQLPFVSDHQPVVLVILAKAYLALGDKRWTPLAIVDDERGLVGVVALADRAGTCEMSISPSTGVISIAGSVPARWQQSSPSARRSRLRARRTHCPPGERIRATAVRRRRLQSHG